MTRTDRENCSYFYRVRINIDYFPCAKNWCDSHDSQGLYWLVIAFAGYSHDTDIILEFGFSEKSDQMLFMLQWS